MTDVELPSTVPSSRSSRRLRAGALGGAVVTVLCGALVMPRHAVADSLANARAQAAQITAQLTADQHHLDVVSQQYEAAQQQVQQASARLTQIRATIAKDEEAVGRDETNLRRQAVASYMEDSTGGGIQTLFSTNSEQATAANEYRSVASADISGAIDSLQVVQTHLAQQQRVLQSTEAQDQAALDAATAARQQAEATVANQESLLNGLSGRIATLVAQQQAAQAAAEHARFEARLASPASQGPGRGTLANLPAAGGAARALAAAESQIGVPYVWGGESPGRGFDCSGLTQWSWGQAGVGLPRTAAAQYGAVAHIPLGDLQPGDLVFWGYGGGISHVAMYVGGGNVVDAPQTGQDVQIQPIWGGGLVGAGRP